MTTCVTQMCVSCWSYLMIKSWLSSNCLANDSFNFSLAKICGVESNITYAPIFPSSRHNPVLYQACIMVYYMISFWSLNFFISSLLPHYHCCLWYGYLTVIESRKITKQIVVTPILNHFHVVKHNTINESFTTNTCISIGNIVSFVCFL